MEKFTKKDLFYLIVIGVLILSSLFFFVKSKFAIEKYENYRALVINRSIEGSIQLLNEYIEKTDGTVSARLSPFLEGLPLKSEERESVRAFVKDVAVSASDSDAKSRSLAYAKTLLSCLIENRAEIKKGNTDSIPLYPELSRQTLASEGESKHRKKAQRLLGTDNLTVYERTSDGKTLYCYRTASAYAEFSDDGLIRYLSSVKDWERITREEAEIIALNFIKKYVSEEKVTLTRKDSDDVFSFSIEGIGNIDVSVSGVVRRFLRQG